MSHPRLSEFEYKDLPHPQRAIVKRFFLFTAEVGPSIPEGAWKDWFYNGLLQAKDCALKAITHRELTAEELEKLNDIENFDPAQEISPAYKIDSEGVKND